ncbi:Hsp20/alpha crystallin family protein [Terrimonas ferruginea]|uniref:Hsp20/alpha crystallin family protein n=1 Tax=Terrimonas ferruginea TaxID=249 RepID=UPI0003FE0628|nr:Hsp20/alpha crystallin family protein [Terrimonas ferruginea]
MTHAKFGRRGFDGSFNNFVNDLFSEMPVLFKNDAPSQWKGFVPVNITETEKSYSLDIVAPGFDKADFKVNLDQQILTISAERKEDETKDEKSKTIRNEYRFRSFKRSFTLDEKIASDQIEAKYVNGVLTLNLPKKEEQKTASKEISIL